MENVNKQLLEALKRLLECYKMADHRDGYCCCGSPMDRHGDPINCGHSAVDAGEYNASIIIEDVKSAIAAAEQAQQAEPRCACGDSFTSDAVCANCLAAQQQAEPVALAVLVRVAADTALWIRRNDRIPNDKEMADIVWPFAAQPPAVAVPEWLTFDRLVNSLAIFVYGATQNPLRDQLTLDHWENTLNDMASQSSMFNAMAAVRAMLAAAQKGGA